MIRVTTLFSVLGLATLSLVKPAEAFDDGAFRIGAGYYSQNAMGKTTRSVDGSASLTGAMSLPVLVKYDFGMGSAMSWFFSPQLSYTPFARASAGDSAETTMLQLILPFGQDFHRSTDVVWEWQFGPGLTVYNVKGKGGVETLSNGTSTSQFARPARSVTIQTLLFELGAAASFGNSRVGLDLILEGLLSAKRSQSFLLSYSYRVSL